MSLHPQELFPVPEETRRVAQAAFPNGTLCLRIGDHLGTLYQDSLFAASFPARGQPAEAPARLALVTVLQFVEGCSDRRAAAAVRVLNRLERVGETLRAALNRLAVATLPPTIPRHAMASSDGRSPERTMLSDSSDVPLRSWPPR